MIIIRPVGVVLLLPLLLTLSACPGEEPPEPAAAVEDLADEIEKEAPSAEPDADAEVDPPDDWGDEDLDEFTWLTPTVRAGILALPSLEPRSIRDTPLFRPTGKMEVREETFAANESMSLLVAVEAEQRFDPEHPFAPVTLWVRVAIDADGELSTARHVRTETAEDVELYELLGVER